jgi:hypothetical protein
MAKATDAGGQDGGSAVAGWADFVSSLRTLPDRMLARLPEDRRNDPQIQQEVGRLALESLASNALVAIGADGTAPQFLPAIGQVLNVGQPNADTVYRSCVITPGASYRLRGRRGSLTLAVIAQVIPQGTPGAGMRSHLNLAHVQVDGVGRFDVLISPVKPEGHRGDWWELNPAATQLMIRMVSADWSTEISPTLSIECISAPIGRPRVAAETLEHKLRRLPVGIDYLALMFVDHFEKLRQQGFINSLKIMTLEFGALDGQFYYEGTYDLADDEALIIESPIPAQCNYRSLILTNEIYETIDWYNNHSSLNGAQAGADPDGKLRIVVSARDPGVRNWLDTAGHARGIIQGRWTGCDSQPIPTVRKLKVGDVLEAMPSGVATVTVEQRQQILRERRSALQQRPLW